MNKSKPHTIKEDILRELNERFGTVSVKGMSGLIK